MNTKIALVGDFVPGHVSHEAAVDAIQHAAGHLGLPVEAAWIPTSALDTEGRLDQLRRYDAVLLPGGDFHSKEGALAAIRFAREQGWPFFGT